ATFCKARYQPQILAFDIAIVPQLARKPLDRRQGLRRKDPDGPHPLALLRARRERPCHRGTGEKRDELAAPHSITSLPRAVNTSDKEAPSDAAVFRLIAM